MCIHNNIEVKQGVLPKNMGEIEINYVICCICENGRQTSVTYLNVGIIQIAVCLQRGKFHIECQELSEHDKDRLGRGAERISTTKITPHRLSEQ